jgi:para-aminobenzoate synthetase/4-amino-4-deoxychorismate lyase
VRFERTPLDCALAPLDVLRLLRNELRPFALVGKWAGGGALLGCDPVAVAEPSDDPFELLDRQPPVAGACPEGGGVGGGWFGYLGYSLGDRLEALPPAPPRPVALPPFDLAFYDHVLRLDADGQWWFEALGQPANERRLEERLAFVRELLAGPLAPPARPYALGPFSPRPGRRGHAQAVEWCRRYIAAGDLYQANLCLRLEADFAGDPLDLFRAAAEALAPDRGAYFSGPWGAVASLSPELFLRRSGRAVATAPIKGTRPQGDGQRAALIASAKDRAENVMIVDLMRNDLGKASEYGSIAVPALAQATAGPGVWHLVSEVTGTLAGGATDGSLVRGCFPPGSVTGAPKIKAMEVIAGLESTGREVYTGAIGFASPVAGLELSVAIRTFELAGGRAWLGAGGGITWGSDPDAEYRECLTKARPLIAAAGGVLEEPAEDGAPPLPAAPTRRARPDPARGVFETLLAIDGRPLLLREHLRRLGASMRGLYAHGPAADCALAVERCAATGRDPARLRVLAVPGADVRVERLPVDPDAIFPAQPRELRALVLPGGLGCHKWVDRDVLAGGHEALIVDIGGELLESGAGNVFAVEQGTLVTPPLDGRILAGVTRDEVIRIARDKGLTVRVEPLDTLRARAADELFVTSAIRGLQPIACCDGVGEWAPGPVAAGLARTLRAEWTAATAVLPQRA